ncbi:hypothetical protein [Pseudomonas nicosulfuronedens]
MLEFISAIYEGLKDEYRHWRDGPLPPQPQPVAANPPAPATTRSVPPPEPRPPARNTLPPLKNWAHPVGDKSNPLVQLTNLAKATAGYYPVGRYGMWHGGVHFDSGTAGMLDQSHVRCLADGEVVAYRIAAQTPITTYYTPEKKLVQAQFSVGFVLVRHHLQGPKLENSTDTPPSLIFYSLYMHLQDWRSYEMLPQTPRPVFWKANSYKVKADVADPGPLGLTVHERPSPGSKVLRELERGQRVTIRGTKGYVELRSVDGVALSPPGYVRIDALESTSGEYRVRQDALGQVKGQHLNVHAEAKAKSTVLATLPRGTEVVISGEGDYRKLESVLAVEPTGPASDDFKSPQGYLRFSALEPVIIPQQVDVIVIPEQPIPIKAGALLGHIGPYQTDVGQPQYKLHLETFTAENLPKFLEASREWAKRLPEKENTWLKLAKGTLVVTEHQGSGPPSVTAANTPSGNDLLVPRSLLDGLRAEDKREVAGEKLNWYRLTGLLNDDAGKPLDGWVCEKVGVTPWVSPWHWDGYAIIHDYGPLQDGLAYSLNIRGLLVDADVERLRPRIDRWDQGPVKSRLYDIIDTDGKEGLSAKEITTALGIPAKAQSIAQLVIEYESEWHYRQAKWDDLDEVLGHTSSTPLLNWMAEKERIRELKWWSDVAGRVGLPEGGRVYHLHPIGLMCNFARQQFTFTLKLMKLMYPYLPDSRNGDLQGIADELNEHIDFYKLNTALRRAHFFAQILQETGPKLKFEEDLTYSSTGLKSMFSYFRSHPSEAEKHGFSIKAGAIKSDGTAMTREDLKAIANGAYGARTDLGNRGHGSGDGWNCRGRGLKHLTGLYNYTEFNEWHKLNVGEWPIDTVDFVVSPDLLLMAKYAARSAANFWVTKRLYELADLGSAESVVDLITDVVNKDTDSRGDRKENFNRLWREGYLSDSD